jgi:hypothetical protein
MFPILKERSDNMTKNILILSNTHLFTVFSQLFLNKTYTCTLLNVRFPNEKMTKEEHFMHQLSEVYHHFHYKRGLVRSTYLFSFTTHLSHRISFAMSNTQPHVIVYEMKTFEEHEWILLRYLHQTYPLNIVAFIPPEQKSKETMFKLAEHGVREVITQLDEDIFKHAVKRNLKEK